MHIYETLAQPPTSELVFVSYTRSIYCTVDEYERENKYNEKRN